MKRLLIACVLAACGGGGGKPAGPTVPAGGPPLAMTLPALDGGEVDLAAYRGKLVVLHVFTTWSLAAQAELESLAAADAADDVVAIGVALDVEGHALVAPWRNGAGVRYLITLGGDAVAGGGSPLGKITTVPTTIILGADGRVRQRLERALAPGEIEALLTAARAE